MRGGRYSGGYVAGHVAHDSSSGVGSEKVRRYDVLRHRGQRDHKRGSGAGQEIAHEWRICQRCDQ
ncbi:hypothetical protein STRTUCAR8_03817 [Streptomyces turgidiscabies Car8]|uniref:Uncharacterized protein n=1 Tax=Streptomyces turgidiscabies (strain Car8) TaxID=698760 RepID=L7FBQ2_STRT8|nr:hypothetical protein STRTUCAR8_03817 [Streptomyces turgidiscabies Car8]